MTMKKHKHKAQKIDPLRALFAAYAPKYAKEDLYKLIIINADLSSILEKARQPMQALTRLQFWQIQLEKIHHGEIVDTIEAHNLAQLIKCYNLDMEMLQRWILIRQKDYEHLPHKNIDDFDQYLKQTSGNFMIFWGNLIHNNKQQKPKQLQTIGSLWGLAGNLRSIRFHAHLGLCHLPQDLLYEHGLLLTDHWRPSPKDNLSDIVEKMAARANTQLKELKQQNLKDLDKTIQLHIITISQFLDHMKILKFDPFHPAWEQIPKSTYLKILSKGIFG